ncbi:MAG: alpha/beta hydrolase, partial [Candidatus Dormiibacterota bacterium]
VFECGGRRTRSELAAHTPRDGWRERIGIPYGDRGAATTLDVFTPAAGHDPPTTIVWIHGGAWISGSKDEVAPYLRILAARGYAAVAVNYSVGPERHYPLALHELNAALAYLVGHAPELGIDPGRLVLAGDSAGAQLASQMAALVTNPSYAARVGVAPAIAAAQLRGVILHCGIYELGSIARANGVVAWGLGIALWSWSGTRDWRSSRAGTEMGTIDHVTSDFPPTYLSGGNGDGLTEIQTVPMARRLRSLGVPVTTQLWEGAHEPRLPHEYQFHLQFSEAHEALESTVTFLAGLGS